MLRIAINEALPGMCLASPVTHPDRPGSILLKAGYKLNAGAISRLEKLGRRELWIRYPGMEKVAKHVNPVLSQFRYQLAEIARDLFTQFNDRSAQQVNLTKFDRLVSQFVEEMLRDPDASLFIPELGMTNHAPPYRHAATVCYLSVLLGLKLEGYLIRQRRGLSPNHASSISSLAIAGLLHDVGMEEIDPEWLVAWREDRDESDPQWQSHLEHGYRMVSGRIPSVAAASVLHHHQYFDGSGYPRKANWEGVNEGLRGDQIHVFARILAVADQFDELRNSSMIHPWPVSRALKALVAGPCRRRLDPVILRGLLEIVPAFAPGSAVILSDARKGYVLGWRPSEPCRPIVGIIEDLSSACDGETPDIEFVDLSREREIFVIEAEGQDVSHDYFDASGQLQPRGVAGLKFRGLDVA